MVPGKKNGEANPWPAFSILVTLTVLSFGSIIRLFYGTEPLWLDELHTLWAISGSWEEVFPRSSEGNQSPAFFLILKLIHDVWESVSGGVSARLLPLSIRVLSICAGIFWLLLTTRFVTRYSGSRSLGLCIGGIQTIHLASVYYSVEARPYTVVALIATILFIRLVDTSPHRIYKIWSTIFLLALMFYFHYTAIFFITFYFPAYWFVKKCPTRTAVLSTGVLFVLLIPGLWHLYKINANSDLWNLFISVERFLFQVRETMVPLVLLPIFFLARRNQFGCESSNSENSSTGKCRSECHSDPFCSPQLIATLILILCPVVTVYTLTWYKIAPISDLRFLISSLSVTFCFPAIVARSINGSAWKRSFAILSFLVFLITSSFAHSVIIQNQSPVLRNENWQKVVTSLTGEWKANENTVLLFSNLLEDRLIAKQQISKATRAYLKFPLLAFPEIRENEGRVTILPQSSSQYYSPSADLCENLSKKSSFYVVARLPKPTMEKFLLRIEQGINQVKKNKKKLTLTYLESGSVLLIKAKLEGISKR